MYFSFLSYVYSQRTITSYLITYSSSKCTLISIIVIDSNDQFKLFYSLIVYKSLLNSKHTVCMYVFVRVYPCFCVFFFLLYLYVCVLCIRVYVWFLIAQKHTRDFVFSFYFLSFSFLFFVVVCVYCFFFFFPFCFVINPRAFRVIFAVSIDRSEPKCTPIDALTYFIVCHVSLFCCRLP